MPKPRKQEEETDIYKLIKKRLRGDQYVILHVVNLSSSHQLEWLNYNTRCKTYSGEAMSYIKTHYSELEAWLLYIDPTDD